MVYTISSVLAIYFVLWWVVLFTTLPFGIRSQDETSQTIQGTDPGAPVMPLIARKLIWTTIISAIIFTAAMLLYRMGYLNIARLSDLMGMPALSR